MEIKKGQIVKKISLLIEKKIVTDEGNNKMDKKKILRDKQKRIWGEIKNSHRIKGQIKTNKRNPLREKQDDAKKKSPGRKKKTEAIGYRSNYPFPQTTPQAKKTREEHV